MKRRKISEREELEAHEKAEQHREELLANLQEREAARRAEATPKPRKRAPKTAAEAPMPSSEEPEQAETSGETAAS
jgi:hypothetical protein